MKKVVIWGTGVNTRLMLDEHFFDNVELICFIDSYKKTEMFHGLPVIEPEYIREIEYDWIVIPLSRPAEVYEQCKSLKMT